MKNLIAFYKKWDEIPVISRGKMTPRNKSRHCKALKKGLSKQRRAALKACRYSGKSQFGGEGHSSWWD